MLRISVLAFLAFVLSMPEEVCAQKMHAILIGDTKDGSIGAGITENLKNMNSFLQSVETVGQISISKTEIKDDKFNCKSITQTIEQLNLEPTDVVLFYYSGHGFRRDSTQTKFPEFDCRRTSDPDRAELAGIVNDLVQSKKPKFVVALADTCNKLSTASIAAPAAAAFASPADRKAAFQRLFLGYSGTLMMSGAVPGEYSWYLVSGSSLGGFFTNQLLRTINQKILEQGPKSRWEDIAVDATKTIFIPGLAEATYQNPQYAALNVVGPPP
jgi:hypothetical protein